jgi:serine phosphatase RsbU (regulator of sigma subunit)
MPIGIYDKLENFNTTTIKYKENLNIYLFSDGFADQFGGEKGKKYKYKPLKKLFLSVANLSFEKQKEIILQEFNSWKGNNEQVDDITILGIKT